MSDRETRAHTIDGDRVIGASAEVLASDGRGPSVEDTLGDVDDPPHLCSGCRQVFDEVGELLDHECDGLGGPDPDGGGDPPVMADGGKPPATIELSERQRERFERVREDCDESGVPEPTDQQVIEGLLDTWDAVGGGIYSDPQPAPEPGMKPHELLFQGTRLNVCRECGEEFKTWRGAYDHQLDTHGEWVGVEIGDNDVERWIEDGEVFDWWVSDDHGEESERVEIELWKALDLTDKGQNVHLAEPIRGGPR